MILLRITNRKRWRERGEERRRGQRGRGGYKGGEKDREYIGSGKKEGGGEGEERGKRGRGVIDFIINCNAIT